MNSLKKLIKDKSPWLSVFDAFEIIKSKTDLELDHEIAELLISIEINDFCGPYDKSRYFDGHPIRLFRDFDSNTSSRMDQLLRKLASGSIVIDNLNPDLRNYVWNKDDFYRQFELFTEIDLEKSEQDDQNNILDENNTLPLYFKNKIFSIHEATCLITGFNPTSTSRYSNKVSWLEENPQYEEAFDFIYSAVKSGFFGDFTNEDSYINANKLKEFFSDNGIYVDGFNKDIAPQNEIASSLRTVEQTKLKDYQIKNKELAEKIKQLEQELQQETLQSELLQSDYQSSQTEIRNLKSVISEKDKTIQKLKDDVLKENGDVFILCMELDKAKHDMEKLKTKNEQLESNLLNNEPLSNNLLDLIFDETATDRYAPDLANSIKLWKHLYIENQEIKGKHSYRANHWIKQNTSYQQEGSVEVKRLREVTSPFDSWHVDRKNKLNK